MFEMDRIVAVIKPTEELLEWINSLPLEKNNEPKISLEAIQADCTALLIPPFDTPEEADDFIESIHEGIFENELMGWYIDENYWPANRDINLFNQYFTVEFHSMVFDLVESEFDLDMEEKAEPENSIH